MSNTLIKKEFILDRCDKNFPNIGEPTKVIIKQASPDINDEREKIISRLKKDFSYFIEVGGDISYSFYQIYCRSSSNKQEFYDDRRNRLLFIKEHIPFFFRGLRYIEVYSTLSECNIGNVEGGGDLFAFDGDHCDQTSFNNGWSSLPSEIQEEIQEKVYEINTAWKGESDRIIDFLITEHHLEQQINFQKNSVFEDLALNKNLTSKSVFRKSKDYLASLVDEINRFVFENKGIIRSNVSMEDLYLCPEFPPHKISPDLYFDPLVCFRKKINPPENIILYINSNPSKKQQYGKSFIGVLENGVFDIRIIASRDKFEYWDIDIERIIDRLRAAIKWWQTESLYTEADIEGMANIGLEEENRSFFSEFYGNG